MYTDFIAAMQAGMTCAPATLAQREGNWYLYNPTQPQLDDAPHVLVTENGMLMPLNHGGSLVLATFAFTGGNA